METGALIVTTGMGFTVTVTLFVPVHPEVVPVTEYVVVEEGETEMPAVVCPVLHRYVSAPETVIVVASPAQMVAGGLTVTTGEGSTVIETPAVPVQPAEVPVTV
jgi:hypothetical protein